MSRVINKLSDGFWDWMTCKGRLNKFEYQLYLLAYILYLPLMIYCVVLGGIALRKYDYPWQITLEWFGTFIIFIIGISGLIGTIHNYQKFKEQE